MGTNYYMTTPHAELIHIGKSSVGWVFALHISTPGRDEVTALGRPIRDWLDMKWAIENAAVTITDEYGSPVTAEEMIHIVEEPWSRPREEALKSFGMGRWARVDAYGRWRWGGPRYPKDSRYVGSPPDEFPYDYFCGDFS